MEFMLLVSFMLMIFVIFFGIIQYRMAEATHDKEIDLLRQVGDSIKNEFALADIVEDGYEREFEIPTTIIGREYIIKLTKYGENRYGLDLAYEQGGSDVFVLLPMVDFSFAVSNDYSIDSGIEISHGPVHNKKIIKKQDGIITLEPFP